ncbi:hypothetical protein BDW75DRAFT_18734 [Aspergillus navahoensis]
MTRKIHLTPCLSSKMPLQPSILSETLQDGLLPAICGRSESMGWSMPPEDSRILCNSPKRCQRSARHGNLWYGEACVCRLGQGEHFSIKRERDVPGASQGLDTSLCMISSRNDGRSHHQHFSSDTSTGVQLGAGAASDRDLDSALRRVLLRTSKIGLVPCKRTLG